ncbi:MAG: GAF domain-containing protein [Calothrix sp. MO_167.B12]|nr:GAF domain-containing protein [Calothrix sp. MO_167.B12]
MTQISQDIIKDLVASEGVTDNELEVLVLAFNGKSPAEIKTILGRQSENAVQKTLSRIYTKFRIPGAGPGKMSKLQKILLDRLQAKQGKRRVLIAWVSSNSKYQAEKIRDVIFKHPQIEAFILDMDGSSSSTWLQETEQLLSSIDFGVLCLPKDCLEAAWVNFLIGLFSGKLQQNFKLLRFSKKMTCETPINFYSIDGTEKNNLAYLLHEIVGGDIEEAKDWINYKLSTSNWLDELVSEEELDSASQTGYSVNGEIINTIEPMLKDSDNYRENQILQQIINHDVSEFKKRIDFFASNQSGYKIQFELYPRYLTDLQRQLQVRVKAVAIVDGVESFWASDKGDEVAKTANPESERLFVFSSEKDFENSLNFLLIHASYYNVFVTTEDIYLPYAEEFSLRDNSNIWNIKSLDSNLATLPTKEYAIIETTDGNNQLMVWYDQDNIKESRSTRLANFSPLRNEISQYKTILSDFLARASRNEGVYQIGLDNSNKQKKSITNLNKILAQKLEQIKDNLFRKSQNEILKYPNALLQDLQKIRNDLNNLNNKDDIIDKALRIVCDRLNCQTASIFLCLFSKDGYLHRQKIVGVDAKGHEIDDKWFEDEKYKPGENFAGQAALPDEDGFGKPHSANDLSEIPLDTKSKKKYSEKLGGIYAAIAVPLDGQHKTYGVLEIINKVDPDTKKTMKNSGFSQEEIHWLSTIGSSIASAISNLRKKLQVKLLGDLSDALVGPCSNLSDIQNAYRTVVTRLISENTAFEVCILRVKNENNFLKVEDKAKVDRIRWDKRSDELRGNESSFVGKAVTTKKPVTVTGINNQNIKEFKNQDWIKLNQFKSFGCFPLIYKAEVVGTLSLYTGYEYDFHPGCQEFLQRVASLTAAFIGRVKELEAVDRALQKLDDCPVQSTDLSKLPEEELRHQLYTTQKSCSDSKQILSETFRNPHEHNNTFLSLWKKKN